MPIIFFRPTISAERQAAHFSRSVELELGDFPPVLDVEVLDGVSKKELLIGGSRLVSAHRNGIWRKANYLYKSGFLQ